MNDRQTNIDTIKARGYTCWRVRSGAFLQFDDMSDTHLSNVVAYLERTNRVSVLVYDPYDPPVDAYDPFMDVYADYDHYC